jgi:hypothetical protein
VAFYTVKLSGRKDSEYMDFFNRMSVKDNDRKELIEINNYINNIGDVTGADKRHFRDEGAAEALPPEYHKIKIVQSISSNDFGLRLYCIALTKSVVILMNGDRKTAQHNSECPNCKPHFDRAVKLSKLIDKAILDKDVSLIEKKLEIHDEELIFNL